MVTGSSMRGHAVAAQNDERVSYDYVKAIVRIANKNGWELDGLDLIPKDPHTQEEIKLTRKQITERDRLLKNILQRFAKLLTPPVPLDLERSILEKDEASRLPWEKEVINKASRWRHDIAKIKPEILRELDRVI
jgi:hypothetical protein